MNERPTFSASNLLRRKLCPGSLRLESKMAPLPDDEWSAEGRLLHLHMANRELTRDGLTEEQREALQTVEKLEAEFIGNLETEHQ